MGFTGQIIGSPPNIGYFMENPKNTYNEKNSNTCTWADIDSGL